MRDFHYYVYNGHGDVVALVDAQGNVAASYAYDAFGQLTTFRENFGGTTTWTNPYRYDGRDGVRYDGRDGVRYDGETGLYWMSVRAYDPALGRFLSRDPLGRSPLFFADQPYVYAGNNPIINVDPSGQFMATEGISQKQAHTLANRAARIHVSKPVKVSCRNSLHIAGCRNYHGWMEESEGDRMHALMPLLIAGVSAVIIGAAAQMFAYWTLFKVANSLEDKADAMLNFFAVIATVILPMVAMVTQYAFGWSGLTVIANAAVAAYNAARGTLNAIRGFARTGGAIWNFIGSGLLSLLGGIAGGLPGFLLDRALSLAGKAALQFIAAGGYYLQSLGMGILTKWSWDMGQDIWYWCGSKDNRGKCATEPQSYIWM